MVPAPFIVVLDANVLFPFTLRDTLLRAAAIGFYQVRWSAQILDEMARNLISTSMMTEEMSVLDDALRVAGAVEIDDCGCELDDALRVAALVVEECRAADEALAAGDPERASARLHRAPVLSGGEVQGRARLVVAHLGVAARDPIARMQKALALSAFVAHQGAHRLLHVELPLATRWSPARVEEIARAAGRWLEEVYGGSADDRVIAVDGPVA